MSVTLKSPEKEINMSYPAFFDLRKDLAYLTDKNFGKAYSMLPEITQLNGKDKQMAVKHWNKTCDAAIDLYRLNDASHTAGDDFFGFFFAADCDGELSVQGCRDLKDMADMAEADALKQFSGTDYNRRDNGNKATGQDFLDLIDDCIAHDTDLEWY